MSMKRLLLLLLLLIPTRADAQTTSLTLEWSSSGDDGFVGTGTAYDLRFSTSPITGANFFAATQWTSGMPVPAISGTVQSVVISGLQFSTVYYFAIKEGDESGNWSLMSNVLQVTTAPAPDTAPPGQITNLHAR